MKNIILVFLIVFSGVVSADFLRLPAHPVDALVGVKMPCVNYSLRPPGFYSSEVTSYYFLPPVEPNRYAIYFFRNVPPPALGAFPDHFYSNGVANCVAIGWIQQPVSYTPVTDNPAFDDYYDWDIKRSPIPLGSICPNDKSPILLYYGSLESRVFLHDSCESDVAASGGSSSCDASDTMGSCYCPNFSAPINYDYLVVCPVLVFDSSISQKTAITKNALISESNSKLGLVASSSATKPNLLIDIKNTLLGLSARNFGVLGTNAKTEDESNKTNPDSPEFEPSFLDSLVNVSTISPLISLHSSGCPSDISFSVFNREQHISYQPICDFSAKIKPLVIAAARVSAAWIVIGAL